MGGVVMEGLAYLVVMLMMIVILGGPLAILITMIPTRHILLTILKRIVHGFIIAMSLMVGSTFLFNAELPLPVHLIGLFGVAMAYIAIRREYFPEVRINGPLLSQFGLRRNGSQGNSDSGEQYGPVMKWRRNGRSGGNDGHGPEGQH